MAALRLFRSAGGLLLAITVIAVLVAFCPPRDPPPLGLPPGSIEFLIVANPIDDSDAISAAHDLLAAIAADPKRQEESYIRAATERPPPAPEGKFRVLNGDATYRWVEMDTSAVNALFSPIKPEEDFNWTNAEAARQRGEPVVILGGSSKICIWSRNCESVMMMAKQRQEKRFDWFILLREVAEHKLTEAHVADIRTSKDMYDGRPIVQISMTWEGAKRFKRLSQVNKPTDRHWRSLAIVIQNKIISFPTMLSEMSDRVQISGSFDEQSANDLVNRVRAAGQ